MVILLAVAAAVYVAVGDLTDAAVSAVAAVAITLVGVVLEVRTERALDELRRLSDPVASVWRDGRLQEIPATAIVPGDEVAVDDGDVVPADGLLLGPPILKVDESSLTGESHPLDRTEGDPLSAGTTILSGRGTMRVTETGARTRYGRIGTLLARIDESPTPLQRGIRRLVILAGAIAAAFCVAVAAVELLRGAGFAAAAVAGISLAMAAIPEEFPMVFALYLGIGAWRLSRHHALVRRLAKVEALGATTAIASDKTGTLTSGRVEVGALTGAAGEALAGNDERALVAIALRASEPDGHDPLDEAIARHAASLGVERHGRLVSAFPFDPRGRHVTLVWSSGHAPRAFSKGALEPMLDRTRASGEIRRAAEAANERLASKGMRVLALASGPCDDARAREGAEADLRFAGLVAFADPVRAGVLDALRDCRTAGIRVLMVTGDHPLTAQAIAEELGIAAESDAVMSGDEIERISDDELAARAATVNVFARVEAAQKYRLVRALRRAGEVVAVTGDGTNDAPALREADIGIAMGRRGTDVARAAATMVLLDDNFATIVHAVRDGRRIFENLRRAFAYLVAFHVPLLIGAFAVPLLGAPLLLLPIHLVWLEIVLHPTVSLVFEGDPGPADLMRRPPRPVTLQLITRRELARPLVLGVTLTIGVLALYWLSLGGGDVTRARALAIPALVVGQLLLVFVTLAPDRPLWRIDTRANRALLPVIVGSLLSVAAAAYVPPLRALLGMALLGASDWLLIAAVAAASTMWLEPWKARGRGGAIAAELSSAPDVPSRAPSAAAPGYRSPGAAAARDDRPIGSGPRR